MNFTNIGTDFINSNLFGNGTTSYNPANNHNKLFDNTTDFKNIADPKFDKNPVINDRYFNQKYPPSFEINFNIIKSAANETVHILGFDTGFDWNNLPWYKKGGLMTLGVIFTPMMIAMFWTLTAWTLLCIMGAIVLIFKCIENAILVTEGTDAINNGGIDCDLDSGTDDTTSDETTSDAISESDVEVYRKDYYTGLFW